MSSTVSHIIADAMITAVLFHWRSLLPVIASNHAIISKMEQITVAGDTLPFIRMQEISKF
jgi:hypothetical protein